MNSFDSISLFGTSLGTGAVASTGRGVCRVWLPGDDLPETSLYKGSGFTEKTAEQLEAYFRKTLTSFSVNLDISSLSDFSQHLLQLLSLVTYGAVTTYGRLAAKAGNPAGARAVGRVMASNPVPLIIPCHRVVASDGRLTGFSGAGGKGMKKWLLEMEGHSFQGDEKLQVLCGYEQNFF